MPGVLFSSSPSLEDSTSTTINNGVPATHNTTPTAAPPPDRKRRDPTSDTTNDDVYNHQPPYPERENGCGCACTCHSKIGCCGCRSYLDSFSVGYRFCPSDEELLTHYLLKKVNKEKLPDNRISDVDIYQNDPDFITENHPKANEGEWYFFSPRNRKYKNGTRPNRAAGKGYWKVTGPEKHIFDHENGNGVKIGSRRSLVFYMGKPPHGVKTDWIMQEYEVVGHKRGRIDGRDMKLDDYVLYKIYKKVDRGGKRAKIDDAPEQQHQQPCALSNQATPSSAAVIENHVVHQQNRFNHGQYHHQNIESASASDSGYTSFNSPMNWYNDHQMLPPFMDSHLLSRYHYHPFPPNPHADGAPRSFRQPSGSYVPNFHPVAGPRLFQQPTPPPATMGHSQSRSSAAASHANYYDPRARLFCYGTNDNRLAEKPPLIEKENVNEEFQHLSITENGVHY